MGIKAGRTRHNRERTISTMTLIEKAAHAAERKAFEKVLDNFIQKGRTKDAAAAAQELVDMAEKIQGSVWKKESFEVLHMIAGQPE